MPDIKGETPQAKKSVSSTAHGAASKETSWTKSVGPQRYRPLRRI